MAQRTTLKALSGFTTSPKTASGYSLGKVVAGSLGSITQEIEKQDLKYEAAILKEEARNRAIEANQRARKKAEIAEVTRLQKAVTKQNKDDSNAFLGQMKLDELLLKERDGYYGMPDDKKIEWVQSFRDNQAKHIPSLLDNGVRNKYTTYLASMSKEPLKQKAANIQTTIEEQARHTSSWAKNDIMGRLDTAMSGAKTSEEKSQVMSQFGDNLLDIEPVLTEEDKEKAYMHLYSKDKEILEASQKELGKIEDDAYSQYIGHNHQTTSIQDIRETLGSFTQKRRSVTDTIFDILKDNSTKAKDDLSNERVDLSLSTNDFISKYLGNLYMESDDDHIKSTSGSHDVVGIFEKKKLKFDNDNYIVEQKNNVLNGKLELSAANANLITMGLPEINKQDMVTLAFGSGDIDRAIALSQKLKTPILEVEGDVTTLNSMFASGQASGMYEISQRVENVAKAGYGFKDLKHKAKLDRFYNIAKVNGFTLMNADNTPNSENWQKTMDMYKTSEVKKNMMTKKEKDEVVEYISSQEVATTGGIYDWFFGPEPLAQERQELLNETVLDYMTAGFPKETAYKKAAENIRAYTFNVGGRAHYMGGTGFKNQKEVDTWVNWIEERANNDLDYFFYDRYNDKYQVGFDNGESLSWTKEQMAKDYEGLTSNTTNYFHRKPNEKYGGDSDLSPKLMGGLGIAAYLAKDLNPASNMVVTNYNLPPDFLGQILKTSLAAGANNLKDGESMDISYQDLNSLGKDSTYRAKGGLLKSIKESVFADPITDAHLVLGKYSIRRDGDNLIVDGKPAQYDFSGGDTGAEGEAVFGTKEKGYYNISLKFTQEDIDTTEFTTDEQDRMTNIGQLSTKWNLPTRAISKYGIYGLPKDNKAADQMMELISNVYNDPRNKDASPDEKMTRAQRVIKGKLLKFNTTKNGLPFDSKSSVEMIGPKFIDILKSKENKLADEIEKINKEMFPWAYSL